MRVLVAVFSPVPSWTIPEREVERLRGLCPHLEIVHARDAEAAEREVVDAEVVFAGRVPPPLLAAASALQWIHSPAAGVAGLLYPAMLARDIVITNARGVRARAVAEHVLAMALALMHKLPAALRHQRERTWAQLELVGPPPVHLVGDLTVGIVGLGSIGTEVARVFAALGARIVATRLRVDAGRPAEVAELYPPSSLPELVRQADLVVLSTPLTAETRGLIGARELRLMKPAAMLINVGRGKLVRETDLVEELERGTLAGAALDVFEHEPLDRSSRLWSVPNIVITPHTSGEYEGYWRDSVDLFVENLRRFERGVPLLNTVDKRRGY